MSLRDDNTQLLDVNGLYAEVRDRERIAEGTTAVVYKARWRSRKVALKEFVVGSEDPGDSWLRAVEEIRILRRLSGPFVVPFVFGGFIEDGGRTRIVLATKYYKGCTLEEILSSDQMKQEPYRLSLAYSFLAFGVKAISYLARKGIMHRDLKPENVFVTREHPFSFKLIDFGLARRMERAALLPSSWEINGASRFRSPQKWRNFHEVEEKDELWSVGVILFRILNGYYPFESRGAAGSEAHLRDLVRYAPPAAKGLVTRHTSLMNRYVAWLLRKDSRMRPSIGMVRRSLRASQTDTLGADLNAISSTARRFLLVGKEAAKRLCSWTDAAPELKVALVCERAIAVGSWKLDADSVADYLSHCVAWLYKERLQEGGFPSITLGNDYATTYCTSIALIALARAAGTPGLAVNESKIGEMIERSRAALLGAQQRKGWSWFVGAGVPDPIASHWAALALAEAGNPLPLQKLLVESLGVAVHPVPHASSSTNSRIGLALYCAARLGELNCSSISIDRAAAEASRIFFSHALRGRVEPIENVKVDSPRELQGRLGNVEFLLWRHPTAALAAYALFSYSVRNPYFLDGGLRLIGDHLSYLRRTTVGTFAWAWASIALSRLDLALRPAGELADSATLRDFKEQGPLGRSLL